VLSGFWKIICRRWRRSRDLLVIGSRATSWSCAAARLADDRQRAAALEFDIDPAQRLDRRSAKVVALAERAGFEDRRRRRPAGRRRRGTMSPRKGRQDITPHATGNVPALARHACQDDRSGRAQALDDVTAAIGKGAADG
jgi:hypothetical protein